jgi:macrolide transport system ATP-binding/permease protein
MVYLPARQFSNIHGMTFELQASTDLLSLSKPIRNAVGKDIAITDFTTLEKQVDESLMRERLLATLTSFFGLVALVLSSIGLYGVMSYAVRRKTSEIGIRMALGAQRHNVLHHVFRKTLSLALWGMVIGVLAAFALTRFTSAMLFGLTPTDPLTIVTALGVTIFVASLAGYLPARRASRLDPLAALRQ